MNVYDTANRLAYEIKESDEYKDYKKLKKVVEENSNLKEKLNQFEKMRYEIQVASIRGTKQDNEEAKEMQKLYLELIQDETMKKYFDAELKFNVLLTDINKIIGDAVQDVIK